MDGSLARERVGAPRAGIAERIWEAARVEFSKRGYHGARVQGIARGASCNVALIYRHWASKKALYLDILRAVWLNAANEIAAELESGAATTSDAVVSAYLTAMNRDPMGAQVLVREYLDGAPFLSQLTVTDPSLLEPVRRAAAVMGGSAADGVDPVLAVVTVGGLTALVASAHEAVRPFVTAPAAPPAAWRRHVVELLTQDRAAMHGSDGAQKPPPV
jgi:AcrR family transcriptional regulator